MLFGMMKTDALARGGRQILCMGGAASQSTRRARSPLSSLLLAVDFSTFLALRGRGRGKEKEEKEDARKQVTKKLFSKPFSCVLFLELYQKCFCA